MKEHSLATMLVTSGFNFEGFRIDHYAGYVHGDAAIQVERGTDRILFGSPPDTGTALMQSLASIREHALQELKEAALQLGCNGVIGVDFDYLTLDPETANSRGGTTYLPYVFGVTANGTAVRVVTAS